MMIPQMGMFFSCQSDLRHQSLDDQAVTTLMVFITLSSKECSADLKYSFKITARIFSLSINMVDASLVVDACIDLHLDHCAKDKSGGAL